ncbi:MAG: glutathione peroxidase [Cyclobacteriaceae bacterium]|nr:glutathione peroxidase [Cyclobacteriaceae bacterium]MCH8516102.1 glutathione peroxidase [Cyclobacteriaceae bacterium]
MKNLFILLFLVSPLLISCGVREVKSRPDDLSSAVIPAEQSIYNFKVESLSGDMIDFSQYKGKKILIVNVASKCGYTPQYKDLQQLHELHGDKVAILGFPANNFGGQEPGSNDQIKEFCQENYGVTFQMFSKVSVKGKDKHPLYAWLTDKSKNGWNEQEPSWNFSKYLIDEEGKLMKFFPSAIKPTDDEMIDAILS